MNLSFILRLSSFVPRSGPSSSVRLMIEKPLVSDAAQSAQAARHSAGPLRPLPPVPSVAALFETHARQQPDHPAVVLAGEVLSYGDLDRRANQLAHYLRALDVGP